MGAAFRDRPLEEGPVPLMLCAPGRRPADLPLLLAMVLTGPGASRVGVPQDHWFTRLRHSSWAQGLRGKRFSLRRRLGFGAKAALPRGEGSIFPARSL